MVFQILSHISNSQEKKESVFHCFPLLFSHVSWVNKRTQTFSNHVLESQDKAVAHPRCPDHKHCGPQQRNRTSNFDAGEKPVIQVTCHLHLGFSGNFAGIGYHPKPVFQELKQWNWLKYVKVDALEEFRQKNMVDVKCFFLVFFGSSFPFLRF